MRNKLPLVVVLWIISPIVYSCAADCECSKDLKCTTLTVKTRTLNGSDSGIVIATKTFCSKIDYNADYAFRDSVRAFDKQYTTDSTIVEQKDSIYKHYEPVDVRHNHIGRYRDSGYFCNCPI